MRGRSRSILALGLLVPCVFPTFSAIGSETVNYTYDARGRLVQVSRSGTVNNGVSASYCYDKADNRTNVTVATAGGGGSTPAFSVNSASATEGGAIIFTVTKCPTASGAMTVDYATSSGSATSGTDFTATSGTLSFLADETGKTITVPTTDDASAESGETLTVALSNASAGSVIGTATGTGTINDSVEPPPSFAVGDFMGTEGGSLFFTVTKTGTVTKTYSVSYQSINNSASSGSDYTAVVGALAFTATETSKTVAIATIEDTIVENAETLYVSLSVPTGGSTITDNLAVGTINDNDVLAPSFAVNDVSLTEGGTLTFTVTRSGTTTGSYTINYATSNGTAVSGSDYTAASGAVTFAPGETSKTVSVATIDDTTVESAETLNLNLSGATGGATISDALGIGTINDNDVAPTASFSIADATEAEGATMILTVTRSGSTAPAVGISFATANNSAIAGSDYNAASGVLSFAANETSKTVSVFLSSDAIAESSETFFVDLTNPTGGATISDGQAIGTIVDVPPVEPPEERCYDEGGRPIVCEAL